MRQTALQFLSLIVLILMVAASAKAQKQYRAHIPFDFLIGEITYKAGKYVVDPLNPDSTNGPVAFVNAKGTVSHVLGVAPGEDYSQVKIAALIFDRIGTQYSLVLIQTPAFIVKLRDSKATSEPKLALNQIRPQTIVALSKTN